MQSTRERHHFLNPRRLYDVAVRAKPICAAHIGVAGRSGEHVHDEAAEVSVIANAFKDFETIHAGHVEVQQHQIWKWIPAALGVGALAVQVGHGLDAVAYGMQLRLNPCPFERLFKKKYVVGIVLRNQYPQLFRHSSA